MRPLVLGLLLLELSGCTGRGESVPLRRLDNFSPYYSGFAQPQRLVVTDLANWTSIWQQIVSFQSPSPALPPVDFTRETVIVVAMGRRDTCGYAITINDVTRVFDTGLSVLVTETSPGYGCIACATAVLTSPVDLVIIPRSEGQVTFVERQEMHRCS